jgi:hypothetical protein
LELQWQLNIDFLHGRQNSFITNMNTVMNLGKQYFWQKREVFNHIAPLVEGRLAKLTPVNETIAVVPLGNSKEDSESAAKCEKIIRAAFKRANMAALVDKANMWSEMTGTAFYKVLWNNNLGKVVGKIGANDCDIDGEVLKEGDVEIVVCSPFEIYPENLAAEDLNSAQSIIHARPFTAETVFKKWGVHVSGGEVDVYDFNNITNGGRAVMANSVMVIERYKDGNLVIVAGDKLIYEGKCDDEMPMPFVRQTCESTCGAFYGKSVIERAIPVQRAYNNTKNRKVEFLNRLSCGVLAVEEGSVDIEALENDGLAPGTIIQYRQGMNAPRFMESSMIPSELDIEEERLLKEMAVITGGSDISRGEFSSVSGVALEIMVEQDRQRIRRASQSGQSARLGVAQKVLKLYKLFAAETRLERLAHGKFVEIFTWSKNDIKSDEVIINGNER